MMTINWLAKLFSSPYPSMSKSLTSQQSIKLVQLRDKQNKSAYPFRDFGSFTVDEPTTDAKTAYQG
jgi:hypothetical protein